MKLTDLEVYRLSEDLTTIVYKKTQNWPKEERYGLTSQTRRAAVSVTLNIAEAFGRYHYKDRIKFLHQARGSLFELWAASRIALKVGCGVLDLDDQITNLQVKLANFIRSVASQSKN